ncbi:Imm10 family immunity protein [Streptomyces sp. ME03-5684b]|uniref:Imm10 family immunity protein n=1 Tax=Streptomyces sp. ME03-5684b TaxID=3028681 RepID=UPI0029BA8622|nr:Imm10 family immunity protein [Streptomyces sp. ME03-5684b]MDX3321196.1 Imm10 family immunity protein [Streptomyces sp. ME03-5684b]
MTELSPYWEITTLSIREEVPGVTFSILIADGEDAVENGFYFDIHRFLDEHPDEQNVRNGTDSYCVVNESSGVHYGGIVEVSLLPGLLTLTFNDKAPEVLGLPANTIPLGIAPEVNINDLQTNLRHVLTYGNPQKIPRLNF